MIRFASPVFLILLAGIPVILRYCLSKRRKGNALIFPNLEAVKKAAGQQSLINPVSVKTFLRTGAMALAILALARPQAGQTSEEILTKGIDIMLVLDTSTSMRAEDFKPGNRLDAAKKVTADFINGRKNDRIGIIVFSAISFTQAPLTLDYGALQDFLVNIEIGMTHTDGTAIGTALTTAVNRLKGSEAREKVVILLTDGRNNMGKIDPLTAARVAAALDIKVYTIGAGRPGGAMYPVDDPIFGKRYVRLPEDLDEDTLKQIARETNGLYFRAEDERGLSRIFEQIDELEKTEIKVEEFTEYKELFHLFAWPAFLMFCLETLLMGTVYRKIP